MHPAATPLTNPNFEDPTSYHYLTKLVIVGPSQSGKSCLLLRLTDIRFQDTHAPTIGTEFGTRLFGFHDSKDSSDNPLRIKLQVWDTGGDPRYKEIAQTYYKGSAGYILVLSAKETKDQRLAIIKEWAGEVFTHGDENNRKVPINIFVSHCEDPQAEATTSDPKVLHHLYHDITPEEVEEWEQEIKNIGLTGGVNTFFGSAKTGANVEPVFRDITLRMAATHDPKLNESIGIKVGTLYQNEAITRKTASAEPPVGSWAELPPVGKTLVIIGALASIAALITLFTVPAAHISGIAVSLKLLVTLTAGATGGASILAGSLTPRFLVGRSSQREANDPTSCHTRRTRT